MTSRTDSFTFEDLKRIMRDIPPPPKMRARPEYVRWLQDTLDPAPPNMPPGALRGELPIEEVPYLPFRWSIRQGDKVTFQTLDGETLSHTIEAPKFELKPLDYRVPAFDPEAFRVRYYRPALSMFPVRHIYGGYIDDTPVSRPKRRRRRSRGWRRHVRRTKAAARRRALAAPKGQESENR